MQLAGRVAMREWGAFPPGVLTPGSRGTMGMPPVRGLKRHGYHRPSLRDIRRGSAAGSACLPCGFFLTIRHSFTAICRSFPTISHFSTTICHFFPTICHSFPGSSHFPSLGNPCFPLPRDFSTTIRRSFPGISRCFPLICSGSTGIPENLRESVTDSR